MNPVIRSFAPRLAALVVCVAIGVLSVPSPAQAERRELRFTGPQITRQLAVKFINDEILLDDWLARFYPKQMNVCHKAIEQARKQLLGI